MFCVQSALRQFARLESKGLLCSLRLYSSASGVVRVRFAPSPTGYLHLGGLRTAVHNYLFSKSRGGTFVLRIEDTDQSRFVPGAAENLEKILSWIGIEPDESPLKGGPFGPYVQSQRLGLYREHAERLLSEGKAYKCFCSERTLELMRKEQARRKEVIRYDNRCRHLTPAEVEAKEAGGAPYCLRFRLDSVDGPPGMECPDLVFGAIRYDVAHVEGDPVILKADGYPTYHLANVVDDKFMQISHVFRGVEWQVSTPKHVLLYEAFGWTPPQYGHLPLIMNPDGTKLSKRQNDAFVEQLKDAGFYPEAILSYITESGGAGERGRANRAPELQSLGSLVENFNVESTSHHSFCLQKEKLLMFNRMALVNRARADPSRSELFLELRRLVAENCSSSCSTEFPDAYLARILDFCKGRIHTLRDLVDDPSLHFLWERPSLEEIIEVDPELVQPVRKILSDWDPGEYLLENIPKLLKSGLKNSGKSFKACMQACRIALTGKLEGPSLAELLFVLGQQESSFRLGCVSRVAEMRKLSSQKMKTA